MPLTDVKLRAAKPRDRGYRLPDGGGLHLFVTPSGVRSWRWRYEQEGRERTLVLGRYPLLSLAEARRARDRARDRLAAGRDPAGADAPPAVPAFEVVARSWHHVNAPKWKPHHAEDVLASLEKEVFPAFGTLPVNQVTPAAVLEALRVMEGRGAVETARRVKQRCSAVFAFAMHEDWAAGDPTAQLRGALAPLPAKGRRPALLDLAEARALLAASDAAPGQPATKLALRFLALTAARPGEVGGLRWSELHELDTAAALWLVPRARMKMGRDHAVPLSRQAVACLAAIRPLTGRGPLAFPNLRDSQAAMSENAMARFLIRLGYRGRHVPHGWRATFSTLMNERYPADRAVIDLMLAHVPKDRVEAAYNRAERMARRRELAQAWADLLLDGASEPQAVAQGPRRSPPRSPPRT